MNWLWPRALNHNSTILVRTGRVLHWVFIALAGYGMIFGWVAQHIEGGKSAYIAIVTGLIFAIPLALIGRGIRYVLSAE